MVRLIEIGTVSARGQIAIPVSIRSELNLSDGEKVLFMLEGDTIIVKKVSDDKTWDVLTKPIRDAVKKSGINESDIPNMIKKVRREIKNK